MLRKSLPRNGYWNRNRHGYRRHRFRERLGIRKRLRVWEWIRFRQR
jgi:hypothetical protein